MADLTPRDARRLFRSGLRTNTVGWAPGFTQANLIAVPTDLADDMQRFVGSNPQACPLLDVTMPGSYRTRLAQDADLRTDLPAYRLWDRDGCAAEVSDVAAYWREDLVAFLLGCSFTFERALVSAGIPMRHVDEGVTVPMYRTNRTCVPAGRLHGPLVVSMRPVPSSLVGLATTISGRYPAMHGPPVHAGDPAALGIDDLARPDYGDPVTVRPDEVPVFWACGVTSQAAVMASRPDFAISHAPGHMFITDIADDSFRVGPPHQESAHDLVR